MTQRTANNLTLLLLIALCVLAMLSGCTTLSYDSKGKDGREKHVALTTTKSGEEIVANLSGLFDGVATALGPVGLLTGGTGLLGALGLGAKVFHSLGKSAGKDIGWDEREKAARVDAPLPASTTP